MAYSAAEHHVQPTIPKWRVFAAERGWTKYLERKQAEADKADEFQFPDEVDYYNAGQAGPSQSQAPRPFPLAAPNPFLGKSQLRELSPDGDDEGEDAVAVALMSAIRAPTVAAASPAAASMSHTTFVAPPPLSQAPRSRVVDSRKGGMESVSSFSFASNRASVSTPARSVSASKERGSQTPAAEPEPEHRASQSQSPTVSSVVLGKRKAVAAASRLTVYPSVLLPKPFPVSRSMTAVETVKDEPTDVSLSPSTNKRKLDETNDLPQHKRMRADEDGMVMDTERPMQMEYFQHPSFLHLDGNVFIQIGLIRFRLHRSVLARCSHVFEEMFENDKAYAWVECLPLWCLTNVKARDFASLLKGIYDGVEWAIQPPSVATVASVLRAAIPLKCEKFIVWGENMLESKGYSLDLARYKKPLLSSPTEIFWLGRLYDRPEIVKRALAELVRRPDHAQTKVKGDTGILITPVDHYFPGEPSMKSFLSDRPDDEMFGTVVTTATSLRSWCRNLMARRPDMVCERPAPALGAPALPPCTSHDPQVFSNIAVPISDQFPEDSILQIKYMIGEDRLGKKDQWKEAGYCTSCEDKIRNTIFKGALTKMRDETLSVWLGLSEEENYGEALKE